MPAGNAFVIAASVFIIHDERDDIVPEALLHHNQSTHAAIVILKGVDFLKADMEI